MVTAVNEVFEFWNNFAQYYAGEAKVALNKGLNSFIETSFSAEPLCIKLRNTDDRFVAMLAENLSDIGMQVDINDGWQTFTYEDCQLEKFECYTQLWLHIANAKGWNSRAIASTEGRRDEPALENFERALAEYKLALQFYNAEQLFLTEDALYVLESSLALAHFNVAREHEAAGDFEQAFEHYIEANKLRPNEEAYSVPCRELFNSIIQNYITQIDKNKNALNNPQLPPSEVEKLYQETIALYQQLRTGVLKKYLPDSDQQALNEQQADVHYALGIHYFRMELFSQAEIQLKQAVELAPSNTDYTHYLKRTVIFRQIKENNEAIANPDSSLITREIESLCENNISLYQQLRTKEFARHIPEEDYQCICKQQAEAHQALAEQYFKRRRFLLAAAQLKQAVRLMPEEPRYRHSLSQAIQQATQIKINLDVSSSTFVLKRNLAIRYAEAKQAREAKIAQAGRDLGFQAIEPGFDEINAPEMPPERERPSTPMPFLDKRYTAAVVYSPPKETTTSQSGIETPNTEMSRASTACGDMTQPEEPVKQDNAYPKVWQQDENTVQNAQIHHEGSHHVLSTA